MTELMEIIKKIFSYLTGANNIAVRYEEESSKEVKNKNDYVYLNDHNHNEKNKQNNESFIESFNDKTKEHNDTINEYDGCVPHDPYKDYNDDYIEYDDDDDYDDDDNINDEDNDDSEYKKSLENKEFLKKDDEDTYVMGEYEGSETSPGHPEEHF